MTDTMKFEFSILDSGDRIIEGRASLPVVDRQKEIVLRKALENALPDFMVLPIITYNHTERPVGICTEAHFGEDDGLYIKAKIKHTKDADDVWEMLQKGDIKTLSITGRRLKSSPSCKLNPERRTTPCETHDAHIYAITLVGKNRLEVNPHAYVNIVKSLTEVDMTDNKTPELSGSEQDTPDAKIIKSTPEIETLTARFDSLAEKIDALVGSQEAVLKAVHKPEPEPEPERDMLLKAEDVEDMIQKAVSDAINTVSEKISSLETKIVELEETPINKAGLPPTIIGSLGDYEVTSNYDAIKKSQKRSE